VDEIVCAARGGGPLRANAGDSAADALISSSAAVTSRCAIAWVPPDSGTLAGTPTFLIAALISANTQKTSCSHASQTITDRIWMMFRMLSWWVNRPSVGLLCGIGRPSTVTRASGTPRVSTARATMARTPAATSPAVRRLTVTGRLRPGIGGAISTDLPG
jgi:hypothetical protein